MKHAFAGAVAAALFVAAPAAAQLPVLKDGSSVGNARPLKAYATISPTVHLFGDTITAKLAIVADTKWVDPARLLVRADFAPYVPTQTSIIRTRVGRFSQITWTWTLRCLTLRCVPRVPPSDKVHVFKFNRARIAYLRADGKPAYGLKATWPAVEVVSQISPGLVAFLKKNNQLNWRVGMMPVAAPTYRVSPGLLIWLAVGIAGLFGLAALVLGRRWYLLVRPRREPAPPADALTTLERAIAVLRYAHEHGDETLQRKAFERVAGELGIERAHELTLVAREMAWSRRTPAHEEVEQFAEQAGSAQDGDA